MKKYLIIMLLAVFFMSFVSCGAKETEEVPAADDPVTIEESIEEPEYEQEEVQHIESQGNFPVDLIGKWGEPIEMGLIINIKEDGTLSAYQLNENDPDGELIYYMDGSWHVEGQEVCISINGNDLYYSYDEGTGMLIERSGDYFFTRTDKGIIPD